eukprot:jgi/Botrbrau1/1026/Bobra.114_1s0062.1
MPSNNGLLLLFPTLATESLSIPSYCGQEGLLLGKSRCKAGFGQVRESVTPHLSAMKVQVGFRGRKTVVIIRVPRMACRKSYGVPKCTFLAQTARQPPYHLVRPTMALGST